MESKLNLHFNLVMGIPKQFYLSLITFVRKTAVHMKPEQDQRMTRIFNEYARKTGLLKEKDKNLEGSDIREGISAIISVRIPEEIPAI